MESFAQTEKACFSTETVMNRPRGSVGSLRLRSQTLPGWSLSMDLPLFTAVAGHSSEQAPQGALHVRYHAVLLLKTTWDLSSRGQPYVQEEDLLEGEQEGGRNALTSQVLFLGTDHLLIRPARAGHQTVVSTHQCICILVRAEDIDPFPDGQISRSQATSAMWK